MPLINQKWGSPEVVDTDIRGNISPMSMVALSRFALEQQQADEEQKATDARDAARNRRIAYWGDRGQASWEEPDYEGDALRQRQQAASDIGTAALRDRGRIEGEQAAEYEPGAYARKAQGTLDALRAEDTNYWDPRHQSRITDEYGRKLELATAPAATAAAGRVNVAQLEAETKRLIAQGKLGPDALTALGRMTDAGVFGSDQYGTGMAPAAGTQQQAISAVQRMMSGAQQYPPEVEALIRPGVDAGYSRDEVIAHLKALGKIK